METIQITQDQLKQILVEMIEMVENTPNNYELGEKMRRRYEQELKEIKGNL